ncbi:hypothetical protein ACWGQ5_56710 [Streptomyces sp. NPDC055722]
MRAQLFREREVVHLEGGRLRERQKVATPKTIPRTRNGTVMSESTP